MKLINYLVGIIFLAVLVFPFNIDQRSIIKSEALKTQYNEALKNACDDATEQLITADDNSSLEISSDGDKVNYEKVNLNLDKALATFYQSLYINVGIDNNLVQQQTLKDKIPIIIAVGYDGYYIHTWDETKVNGLTKIQDHWLNKKLYSMIDNKYNIKVFFTLDDTVTVTDLNTNIPTTDNQNNFVNKYPLSCFGPKFQQVRSQIINEMIKKDLDYYTYYNNDIAKRYGWKLNFNIPKWGNRSVNDLTFIAFLQGKIVNGASNYDTYGFGTAKIVQRKPIYGYEKDNHLLYSINQKGSNITCFQNEYEAARNGYSPDPEYYMNYQGITIPQPSTTVNFRIANNNGIPQIRLNPVIDFNRDYIIDFNGSKSKITKDNIGTDGSLVLIPKSLSKNVQVAFADGNPLIFTHANSIDLGMDSGDTPPEVTINTANFINPNTIKLTLQTRDLDIKDNVNLMYRIIDTNTGTNLSGYPSDMNILDSTSNNLMFNSNGKMNYLTGYVSCPSSGDFKIQIWAVDNSNAKSQIKGLHVQN